jgi:hypothetical protein
MTDRGAYGEAMVDLVTLHLPCLRSGILKFPHDRDSIKPEHFVRYPTMTPSAPHSGPIIHLAFWASVGDPVCVRNIETPLVNRMSAPLSVTSIPLALSVP